MKRENAKTARLIHVHPIALILFAIGSLCFSIAAFMSAFPAPPPQAGGLVPSRLGDIFMPDVPSKNEQADNPADADEPLSSPTPEGRAEGMYTVLIFASNDDYNTDTMMIARLDTKNGTLNLLSIPRDTKVNAKNRGVKKINGAYGAAKKKGDPAAGVNGLKGELASLIGFYPDCYAMVDMAGFVELVDAIDGVKFNVPVNMKKDTGDMMINLQKGEQTLNGNKALQLMRYRGYNGSGGVLNDDFGRMQMQQEFLKALAKQTLQAKHIFKVNEFIEIAEKNLTTDLDLSSMTWFATQLMKLDSENISFSTLPVNSRANSDSYVYVKPEEALQMINEKINPFTRDITAQNVMHITK